MRSLILTSRWRTAVRAVLVLALGLPPVLLAPATASAAGSTLFVAPNGSGTVCSSAQPCDNVRAAVNAANAGDEVLMMPGDYEAQRIQDDQGDMAAFGVNVVVRPAVPSSVTVHGFDVYAPHVTLRGLQVLGGGVYLRQRAAYSRVESVEVDGSRRPTTARSVVLAAPHTALVDSWIHDKLDQDHVFIGTGGAAVEDVEVSGNVIGPATLTPGSRAHTDCLQIGTEAHQIRILRNRVFGCSNAALIIKADSGPITDVLVANNEFQGCQEDAVGCNGNYTLYVRLNPATDEVLRDIDVLHNTIDGATSFSSEVPGLRVSGNIIQQIDRCGPFEDHNLIVTKAPGRTVCVQLGEGDVLGTPTYVDAARRDFRPRPDSPALRVGGPLGPTQDIEGYLRTVPTTAGAFELDVVGWAEVTAPASAVSGQAVQVSGRLRDVLGGQPVNDGVAQLWAAPAAGGPASSGPQVRVEDGMVRAARALGSTTDFSLRFVGSRHMTPADSSAGRVVAVPRFTCRDRYDARAGSRLSVSCRVLPHRTRRAVLQVLGGNGVWRSVRTSSTTSDSGTQIARQLVTVPRGTTRYRFLTATDAVATRGTGPTFTVVGR